MSDSFHTRPPRQTAKARFARDRNDQLIAPRIIERKPYPGDIHPITKRYILAFIRHLPIEYTYGLSSIELLPRKAAIGEPYGLYMNDESRIILYSLPWPIWCFNTLLPHIEDWYYGHSAETTRLPDIVEVHWKQRIDIAFFMFAEVFLHELGHHHQNRFRRKIRYPSNRSSCEQSVDRHAEYLRRTNAFKIWHDINDAEQGAAANP